MPQELLHAPVIRQVSELHDCIRRLLLYCCISCIEHPGLQVDIGNDKDMHGSLLSAKRMERICVSIAAGNDSIEVQSAHWLFTEQGLDTGHHSDGDGDITGQMSDTLGSRKFLK